MFHEPQDQNQALLRVRGHSAGGNGSWYAAEKPIC